MRLLIGHTISLIMLKEKYLFGKALFIAFILGCLRYLTTDINVALDVPDIRSKRLSMFLKSGIFRDVTIFEK